MEKALILLYKIIGTVGVFAFFIGGAGMDSEDLALPIAFIFGGFALIAISYFGMRNYYEADEED